MLRPVTTDHSNQFSAAVACLIASTPSWDPIPWVHASNSRSGTCLQAASLVVGHDGDGALAALLQLRLGCRPQVTARGRRHQRVRPLQQ